MRQLKEIFGDRSTIDANVKKTRVPQLKAMVKKLGIWKLTSWKKAGLVEALKKRWDAEQKKFLADAAKHNAAMKGKQKGTNSATSAKRKRDGQRPPAANSRKVFNKPGKQPKAGKRPMPSSEHQGKASKRQKPMIRQRNLPHYFTTLEIEVCWANIPLHLYIRHPRVVIDTDDGKCPYVPCFLKNYCGRQLIDFESNNVSMTWLAAERDEDVKVSIQQCFEAMKKNRFIHEQTAHILMKMNEHWVAVVGDGNCFFRSILIATGQYGTNEEVVVLRQQLALYLVCNEATKQRGLKMIKENAKLMHARSAKKIRIGEDGWGNAFEDIQCFSNQWQHFKEHFPKTESKNPIFLLLLSSQKRPGISLSFQTDTLIFFNHGEECRVAKANLGVYLGWFLLNAKPIDEVYFLIYDQQKKHYECIDTAVSKLMLGYGSSSSSG